MAAAVSSSVSSSTAAASVDPKRRKIVSIRFKIDKDEKEAAHHNYVLLHPEEYEELGCTGTSCIVEVCGMYIRGDHFIARPSPYVSKGFIRMNYHHKRTIDALEYFQICGAPEYPEVIVCLPIHPIIPADSIKFQVKSTTHDKIQLYDTMTDDILTQHMGHPINIPRGVLSHYRVATPVYIKNEHGKNVWVRLIPITATPSISELTHDTTTYLITPSTRIELTTTIE